MTGEQPNIYSSVYYREAPAAIEWLCRAFGLEKRLIVLGSYPQEAAR